MQMLNFRIYLLYILRWLSYFFCYNNELVQLLACLLRIGRSTTIGKLQTFSKILFYIESTINFGLIKIKAWDVCNIATNYLGK